jgi:hypothetical protein
LRWAADSAATAIDPSYWVNFGVLGVIFLAVQTGFLHTKGDYDRTKADATAEIARLEVAHAKELERAQAAFDRLEADQSRELVRIADERNRERAVWDEDKKRLLTERDRANAERDEAYQVVRDFNHMAGGLIQKLPSIGPNPRPRRRPIEGEGP